MRVKSPLPSLPHPPYPLSPPFPIMRQNKNSTFSRVIYQSNTVFQYLSNTYTDDDLESIHTQYMKAQHAEHSKIPSRATQPRCGSETYGLTFTICHNLCFKLFCAKHQVNMRQFQILFYDLTKD